MNLLTVTTALVLGGLQVGGVYIGHLTEPNDIQAASGYNTVQKTETPQLTTPGYTLRRAANQQKAVTVYELQGYEIHN